MCALSNGVWHISIILSATDLKNYPPTYTVPLAISSSKAKRPFLTLTEKEFLNINDYSSSILISITSISSSLCAENIDDF